MASCVRTTVRGVYVGDPEVVISWVGLDTLYVCRWPRWLVLVQGPFYGWPVGGQWAARWRRPGRRGTLAS